ATVQLIAPQHNSWYIADAPGPVYSRSPATEQADELMRSRHPSDELAMSARKPRRRPANQRARCHTVGHGFEPASRSHWPPPASLRFRYFRFVIYLTRSKAIEPDRSWS